MIPGSCLADLIGNHCFKLPQKVPQASLSVTWITSPCSLNVFLILIFCPIIKISHISHLAATLSIKRRLIEYQMIKLFILLGDLSKTADPYLRTELVISDKFMFVLFRTAV